MFPRSANHFLATPEAIETEVVAMNFQALTQLNLDLAGTIAVKQVDFGYEFVNRGCDIMSSDFEAWLKTLKTGEFIAFIQWIAERLAFKHQQIRLSAETD